MKVRAEFVNPFVAAAYDVLTAEMGEKPHKGTMRLENTHYTTDDVTIIVGISGQVSGVVLYGMCNRTALSMAKHMCGETIPIFNQFAESAIGELGNMISGRATAYLEENGYTCNLTPPSIVYGNRTIISLNPFVRCVLPFTTGLGVITISFHLKENNVKEAIKTLLTARSPVHIGVDQYLSI